MPGATGRAATREELPQGSDSFLKWERRTKAHGFRVFRGSEPMPVAVKRFFPFYFTREVN